ncbi:MAG: hypothetical protein FJ109_13325 [Deltaproteobacteria bacterium]|nr:hypothetical protein [Deltaproteobacteria bacterium]
MKRWVHAFIGLVFMGGLSCFGMACGGGGEEGSKDAKADQVGDDAVVPPPDSVLPDDQVSPEDVVQPADNVNPQDTPQVQDNVNPQDAVPPQDVPAEKIEEATGNPGHTESMSGVMHMPGKSDPLKNCVGCHGANLKGGGGPSCYTCHNADDHTKKSKDGVKHKSGTSSTCNACHGPNNSGGLGPACKKCH